MRNWRVYHGHTYTYGAAYISLHISDGFNASKEILEERLAVRASRSRNFVRAGLADKEIDIRAQELLEEPW